VTTRIGIVDYGMGNRRSVEKALEHVGAAAVISSDPDALRGVDGLIVPGVGAFPQAMRNLRERELVGLVGERVAEGVPVLGICLGMQLLFADSTENEGAPGLGLLPGTVERLPAPGLKLPHIGWNLVSWRRPSPLTEGLPEEGAAFYHVHSYAVQPAEEVEVVGEGEYGQPFASVVAHPSSPLFGVQFHPEKSSAHGLALLANFARVCARVSA
jgi:imidazole glycerol-phosphate synthase subunit HisH